MKGITNGVAKPCIEALQSVFQFSDASLPIPSLCEHETKIKMS